jgi:paraquat-inducible protein B
MGLQIGEVADIGFEYDRETQLVRIPVTVHLEPERLLQHGGRVDELSENVVQAHETARRMIAAGMRAQLRTGSLLTGQLYVDLVMQPGSPANYARGASPLFEFPTLPSPGLSQIQDSVTEVLTKIKRLPLERLVGNAADAAESLNKLLSSPELEKAVRNGNLTLQEIQKLAADLDGQLDRLVTMAEGLISPTSPLGVELVGTMACCRASPEAIDELAPNDARRVDAVLGVVPGLRVLSAHRLLRAEQ